MKLIHYVKKLYGKLWYQEHLLYVYKKCVHAKRSDERFWGKILPEKSCIIYREHKAYHFW